MPRGVFKRKPFSEEHKKNLSLAHKGKPSPKGMLGKKHTEETKKKMSIKKKGKQHLDRIGPPKCIECNIQLKGFKAKRCLKCASKYPRHYKNGVSKDTKKYQNERYKNLSDEERKKRSWCQNKRNRVIKRLRIESLSHTFGEWENLKKQYGYTCPCCKKSEPDINLTEDHIIPLSKGGSDLIENIQPLCLHCNLVKHTLIIKY